MTTVDAARIAIGCGSVLAMLEVGVILSRQTLTGMSRAQAQRFIALAFALVSILVGCVRAFGNPPNANVPLNALVIIFSLAGLWGPARARRESRQDHGLPYSPAQGWDGVERRSDNRRSYP